VILQALVEYYERRGATPDRALAPLGKEPKQIPFIVEIAPTGGFVQIVDTRVPDGKRLVAKQFLVPKGTKRSVNVESNLLWDNVEYALGVPITNDPARVAEEHASFVAAITDRFGQEPADARIGALMAFLAQIPLDGLAADPLWTELTRTNPFISFRLAGQTDLLCQIEAPPPAANQDAETVGRCLVSGERAPIARLHPAIKNVRGGNTSGTTLVGFNWDAFKSYGRDQGYNAPVSETAAFKYTTALNSLLAADSGNRAWLGSSTYVFWAERDADASLEKAVAGFFSSPRTDDPDRGTAWMADVLDALRSVSWTAQDGGGGGRFYVLGLAPNAGRLAVRSWTVATVSEVRSRLLAHFADIEIVLPSFARPHPPLFRLLCSTALLGKAENVPPNLQGEVAEAILAGRPYPITLLAAAILRARAEQEVTRERAAVIKAVINRHRRATGDEKEELTVALDPANPNPAYRLGRLFAALERAQETASPGLNATIRDRYYGAASSTPVTVFPRLLDLKNHHLSKIESTTTRAWLERLIGEIVDGIPKIPAHLSLIEQGDFAIGYYHQRQDFFRKHTVSEGESN
jgi:CRISPR-associated protein Csd1